MSYSFARTKYQSIKKRSFESFLDLFLICTYINDKSLLSANIESFQLFNYNDLRIPKVLGAYQLAKNTNEFCDVPVSDLDKAIKNWQDSNNHINYRNIFNEDKMIGEPEFNDFYGEDKSDRECYYCNIKESDIQSLYKSKLLQTKRLSTRGFKMEVDRLSPNEGYVRDNIVLCCYWCNNAKTDEFSAEEFRPIGELIGQTLKNRLNK